MTAFASKTKKSYPTYNSSITHEQELSNDGSLTPFKTNPFSNDVKASEDKDQSEFVDEELGQTSFFNSTGSPVIQKNLKVEGANEKGRGAQNMSNNKGEVQDRNDTGLPSSLKLGLENLSGEDLSGVRVHRNSSKPGEIDAHAYTEGHDIHLAPGQDKHLPHEGWHVVQQLQRRVQPTIQEKSKLINDDSGLEKEADVMGEHAVQMISENSSAKFKSFKRPTSDGNSTQPKVIQRAMKFEHQVRKNRLYRDKGGGDVHSLPRKYGPRDYIIRLNSGARLESETKGQIEYETSWEKKWSKLKEQIHSIQLMSQMMHRSREVRGSDGEKYKEFPWASAITHLRPGHGFPTSYGRWNQSQYEGKARVDRPDHDFENFRSSPSFASDKNIIGKIKNGEKVFVHYIENNYARIKHDGVWGWVYRPSLKMDKKLYESNRDKQGVKSDTPLQPNERLLVKELDPTWRAYIQISESFELEQFESYLKQHEPDMASHLVKGTKQFLLEHNLEEAPKGEALWQKYRRQWNFLQTHNKLKNLLMMVGYYIVKGRSQSTRHSDGTRGPAKWAFSLMSRTHFGSMFKSLSPKEQTLFESMVHDKTNGIIPTMNLTRNTLMFIHGSGTETNYNPTVYDWLVSITEGKDILSSQTNSVSGAMGRFNLEEEKGKHIGLVRFEARRTAGNEKTLWEWDNHARDHFIDAATKRNRPTGKGKTGLDLSK